MVLVLDIFGVAFLGRGLNLALLEGIQPMREKGMRVYFASNISTGQKHIFWNNLNLKAYGTEIFCSDDLNVAKPDPAFYSHVSSAIGASPDSILFFDDSAANVQAAKRSGWQGFLYIDAETALCEIEKNNGI